MKNSSLKRSVLGSLGFLTLLLAPATGFAASATWNINADTMWNSSFHWTPATIPGATSGTTNADTATFGTIITTARQVTVDANRNISGIDFAGNSFAYTLTGGNLLLTNGGTIQTSGGGSAHTDVIGTSVAIQGNSGSATFTGGSSTAARYLTISGSVTGVSTASNVTTLTLNGNTGNQGFSWQGNQVSGNIGDGSAGGKLQIVKSGTGIWRLSGSNSFTGGISIEQGTLVATTNVTALGAASGTVYLGGTDPNSANSATLRIAGATVGSDATPYSLIVRSTDNVNAARMIASGDSINRSLGANIQIGDGSGSINLLNLSNGINLRGIISDYSGNPGDIVISNNALPNTDARSEISGVVASSNTYTGSTTILNGVLRVSKNSTGLSIPGDLLIGTAASVANTYFEISGISGNGLNPLAASSVVTFGSTGSLTSNIIIRQASSSHTFTLAGLNSATGVNAFIGAQNDGNTYVHTLALGGSGTYSYAGFIGNSYDDGTTSRTLAISKTGGGTQEFTGLNKYTGTTSISGGVLSVTTLPNGGTASGLGAATNAASTLVINGGTLRYTGDTTSTDRNFTIGTAGAALQASGSGAVTFAGTSAALAGTNTARTLTLSGTNTANNTLETALGNNGSGATSLTKSEAGTWVLSGSNSYTGATTVNLGTLVISGNIASSATTVSAGALSLAGGTVGTVTLNGGSLTGTGMLGETTVNAGAILAPGNSPGTLTFSGDLNLNAGSFSNFEITSFGGGDYDLTLGGAGTQMVSFGGTLNLTFQSGFNTTGSVKIFDFENYDGAFTTVNTFGLADGYTGSFDALSGSVVVVPEPQTWLLVTAGLSIALFLRRRRCALRA